MTKRPLVDEASNPETPFKRLLQLSKSKSVKVRRALVNNPSIAVNEEVSVTNTILLKLAKKFPDDVAGCSAFALFGLEMKKKVMLDVVEVLAENVSDPSVLTLLLNEFGPSEPFVRRRIAGNPNTPLDVLRFLATEMNEPNLYVREAVASNPKVPEDILRFLADKINEPMSFVRSGVARNSNTPTDTLCLMTDEKNEPVNYIRILASGAMKSRELP